MRDSRNRSRIILQEAAILLGLGVFSLLLHSWYFNVFLNVMPNALQPANDAKSYWEMGLKIYRDGIFLPNDGPYYQAPLYPYWLAGLHYFGFHRIVEALRIQEWMSIANVLLCYSAGRLAAGRLTAALAAALFGLCHYSLFFASKMLAETPGIFLFLLFSIFFLLWINKNKTAWLAVSAFCFSLAVLCRPNLLFFFPPVLLFCFIGRSGEARTIAIPGLNLSLDRRGILFSSVFLLGILPAPLRNGIVGGDWVPICANSGVTLYMGTNEQAEGGLASVEGLSNDIEKQYTQSIELASKLAGKELPPSQASSFWMKKTAAWALSHPGKLLVLEIKKLLWALYSAPPAVNYSAHFESEWIGGLKALSWLTWLSVWGGLLALPWLWKGRTERFFLSLWGGYLLLSLVYYASDRFLAGMLPFTSILTAMWIEAVWRRWREFPCTCLCPHPEGEGICLGKRVLSIVMKCTARPILLIWIGITFVLTANPFLAWNREREIGMGWYNLGVFYEEKSNDLRAMESYEKALEACPVLPAAMLNLGVLYAEQGDLEKSTQLFLKVLSIEPKNQTAQRNLKINRERMNDK
ncbi:MAG: glycosyltransferase family 39 protein [Candidatus Omnitrophota bacterium]